MPRVVAKSNLDPERAKYAFLYQDLSEQVRTSAPPPFASLAPVLDLYLASLRELSYAEFSFNVVVQALETYHRCRHEGQLLPPDRWAPLKNHLLQTIDATLANTEPHARLTLTQCLEHFNELGLRQRVRALLASVAPNVDAVCGGNAKSFVNAVVQTRNYFTHWDPSLQVSAFRGGSLVYLTYRLRGLLEILLLRELGFAPNSAAERAILQRRVSWLTE